MLVRMTNKSVLFMDIPRLFHSELSQLRDAAWRAWSISRSIELKGPGERILLRKRCFVRPGEQLNPVERETL